jgi:DNA-binding XRE family transcriptional regulator
MSQISDSIDALRRLDARDQALLLAVVTVADRVTRLTAEESNDLIELVGALRASHDEAEQREIIETMYEILERRSYTLVPLERVASKAPSQNFIRWRNYVGAQVRKARESKGWTQERLAEKAGIPQSHVSRIETGRHSPAQATLRKLAKAMNVPLHTFDCNHEGPRDAA